MAFLSPSSALGPKAELVPVSVSHGDLALLAFFAAVTQASVRLVAPNPHLVLIV